MWNVNDFCKRFKERKTATEFTEEWEAWLADSEARNDDHESDPPAAKRVCSGEGRELDEKWMDDIDHEIEKHKVGTYVLSVYLNYKV